MGWEDAVTDVALSRLQPRWLGVDVDLSDDAAVDLDAAHRLWIVGIWARPSPALLVSPVEHDLAVTGGVEPPNGDDAIGYWERHIPQRARDATEIGNPYRHRTAPAVAEVRSDDPT